MLADPGEPSASAHHVVQSIDSECGARTPIINALERVFQLASAQVVVRLDSVSAVRHQIGIEHSEPAQLHCGRASAITVANTFIAPAIV